MVEFGGSIPSPPGGQPILLGRSYSGAGADLSATLLDPPAGQLYILTGIDFFGATLAAGQVVGGLEQFSEGVWAQAVDLTTPTFENGGSWRGFIPILSADDWTITCGVRGSAGVATGVIAWGVALEYSGG